jgi:transcriptional regulator with XRE-family HTH domain
MSLQSNACVSTKEAFLPTTTIDVAALHDALDSKRRLHEMSWRELAGELEISPSTFTRLAQGARPDVDAFATLLRWLGEPASNYMLGDEPEQRTPSSSKAELEQIGALLRSSRSMTSSQATAMENIIRAAWESIVED